MSKSTQKLCKAVPASRWWNRHSCCLRLAVINGYCRQHAKKFCPDSTENAGKS